MTRDVTLELPFVLCLSALLGLAGCSSGRLTGPTGTQGGGPSVVPSIGPITEPTLYVPRVVPDGTPTLIAPYCQRSTVFWFGQVDSKNNYVEGRVGYDDRALMVRLIVFDQRIYDTAQDSNLKTWDSLSLFIDLDGDKTSKQKIDARSLRIDAQAHTYGTEQTFTYRGQDGNWVAAQVPVRLTDLGATDAITMEKAYRGGGTDDNRGWHILFYLGWRALGLDGPPEGVTKAPLRVAVMAYDRDSADGALHGAPQGYPSESFPDTDPSKWARWSLPGYHMATWTESGSTPGHGNVAYTIAYAPKSYVAGTEQTIEIRQGLGSDRVENASVGASETLCSGNDAYNFGDGSSSWGNNTKRAYFHVQNQADYADWPCFSKIYLKFPLDKVPAGKAIVSAALKLHHAMPTSGGSEGEHSLIQAFLVSNLLRDGSREWTQDTVTWNNAPIVQANLSGAWGDRSGHELGWTHLPLWQWDVSAGVAAARDGNQNAVSFALYSADTDYHTGKQFADSAAFPDWGDPTQRPTLVVTYADPK